MASVDWKKLHTIQDIKNIGRHCDKECRLKDNHENEHIDKTKTHNNAQMCNYNEFCKRIDKRMEYLDSLPKQNKKSDRVIGFSLEYPIPDGIPDSKVIEFLNKANRLIYEQVGSENVIGSFLHVDEVHDYIDSETKQERTSMRHVHTIVTAAIDGKLNGKAMSSKANMCKLNNAIHEMAMRDYGVKFMDGSKRKSRDEVETLKNKSLKLENEKLQSENVTLHRTRKQLREDIAQKQSEIAQIQSKINQGVTTQDELRKQIEGLQRQLQALQKERDEYLAFRKWRKEQREKERARVETAEALYNAGDRGDQDQHTVG